MGQLILERAVQALKEAGIPAERAAPARKMAAITGPVAAVSLQSADIRNKQLTVLTTVLSPAAPGAAVCEETALEAGEILSKLGGKCSVAKCRFDGRTGLFSVEVTALFSTEVPKITIDGKEMKHVLAFTSWRTLDDTVTDWTEAKWNFRLEEYFPMGESEDANPTLPFILTHTCENGTESYMDSTWTYQRRVWDASGIRQLRLGVAEIMDNG